MLDKLVCRRNQSFGLENKFADFLMKLFIDQTITKACNRIFRGKYGQAMLLTRNANKQSF